MWKLTLLNNKLVREEISSLKLEHTLRQMETITQYTKTYGM